MESFGWCTNASCRNIRWYGLDFMDIAVCVESRERIVQRFRARCESASSRVASGNKGSTNWPPRGGPLARHLP